MTDFFKRMWASWTTKREESKKRSFETFNNQLFNVRERGGNIYIVCDDVAISCFETDMLLSTVIRELTNMREANKKYHGNIEK